MTRTAGRALASAASVLFAAACSGSASCDSIGYVSGFHYEGLGSSDVVTVCVDGTNTCRRVAVADQSPGKPFAPFETLQVGKRVPLVVQAGRGPRQVVTRLTVTPRLYDPNGPGCSTAVRATLRFDAALHAGQVPGP